MMPKIIVITGIDGSGKSTQAHLLKKYLEEIGAKVEITHQFAPETLFGRILLSRIGTNLMQLEKNTSKLSNPSNTLLRLITFFAKIEILLMGIFHTWVKILKNRKNEFIIFDRYFYDNIIKVRWMYGLSNKIRELLEKIVPKPYILFYLDVPAEIAWEREKNGSTTLEQHIKKKNIYDEWFREASKIYRNFYKISTNKEKYLCHIEIIDLFKKSRKNDE